MDILTVEDNLLVQHVIVRFLGDLGYRVLVASRASEALELAAQTRPALVLFDLTLPDMDGGAALQALRRIPGCADVPVICISGLDEYEVQLMVGSQIDGYIAKPIDLDLLRETLARYAPLHS